MGITGNFVDLFRRDVHLHGSKPCRILQCPFQELLQVFLFQPLECEHPAPGEQSGIELKAGIFSRRANECDQPAFHIGQKGILLGFVEAVDLVDKQNRGNARIPGLLCFFHDEADVLHPGVDGGEVHEA